MPQIARRPLHYTYGNTAMSGEFVVDESLSGPRPGILVVHEAFGLGEHAIRNAERLAELGYAALAMDLWGDRAQLTDMPSVMETIGTMTGDRATWMGRTQAALDVLVAQPETDGGKLAAIGYCFGGTTVMEFARTGGNVLGVGSFHGGVAPLGAEWSSETCKAKLLVCTGADDPLIKAEALTAFQQNLAGSGVDWELNLYSGTVHSFTNPAADAAGAPEMIAYNAQSDRRSWDRLVNFFGEIFA